MQEVKAHRAVEERSTAKGSQSSRMVRGLACRTIYALPQTRLSLRKSLSIRRGCALQARLDSIVKVHGDTISTTFSPFSTHLRRGIQLIVELDTLLMYYDVIFGRLATLDRDVTARAMSLLNRAD
jgi:hypothetical protein